MDGDELRSAMPRLAPKAVFGLALIIACWSSISSFAADFIAGDVRIVPTVDAAPAAVEIGTGSGSDYGNVDAALDRRGSVTFRKTSLSEVVFMLSEIWKVNIVAGAEVTGEVSGTFHNTPLREVLSAILTANQYGYRRTGDSLIVLPVDRVGSDDPSFVSQTIATSTTDSTESLEAARLLLSPGGQLRQVGPGMVLVIDHPARVQRVRELFAALADHSSGPIRASVAADVDSMGAVPPAELAAPTESSHAAGIAYFTPQYSDAEPMVDALRQALGDAVNVAVHGPENRIMVLGTAEQLRLAADAIEHLDVPRSQVRIRALIYDVALEELEALGVDWSHNFGHSTTSGNSSSGTTGLGFVLADDAVVGSTGVPLAVANEGSNFIFRSIHHSASISSFINALDSTAGAKLLADPTITVTDRNEASIRIVQKIPITNTSQLGGTTTAVTSVTFEEAGVTLHVIPRIGRDGTIQMQVRPEFSVLVGYQNGQPIIDSRTAETMVRVADRQTFVLGGLRQSATTEIVRGVPFLKDVKYVGRLFRSHRTEVRESELIVFLQPEIVSEFHRGTPREQRALCITSQELDRIPVADEALFIPDCQDKNCPYHHPRPRVNSGSSSLGMIDDNGILWDEGLRPGQVTSVIIADEPVPPPQAGLP